jgi:hypothetical protein
MVLALLLALLAPFRLDAGPYAGAYVVAPGGAVNWYFDTTSLLRLATLPEPETREYLDAYLAHLDPNDGIADVLPMPTGIFAPVAPDSEDAYAATFLSLAVRYRNESHDTAWWSRNADTLSAMAYAKLLTKVKPDGLIRASRTDPTGYLMDNVEDYAGLRSLAGALTATHESDAAYVASFVAPLGIAIHALYRPSERAFLWSDGDPLGPLTPYPACTAQLFPQLFGVRGADAASDRAHFAGARETAAQCRLSAATAPHEALLYGLYIGALPEPSRSERAFVQDLRSQRFADGDIVTLTLEAALRAAHPGRGSHR